MIGVLAYLGYVVLRAVTKSSDTKMTLKLPPPRKKASPLNSAPATLVPSVLSETTRAQLAAVASSTKRKPDATPPVSVSIAELAKLSGVSMPQAQPIAREHDAFLYQVPSLPSDVVTFSLPAAPPEPIIVARWIPRGETVTVHGIHISGGLLYVGTHLKSACGGIEPSLIDTRKNVGAVGDYTKKMTDYWPSYSTLLPEARRAYLTWLAEGRTAPTVDIGFVFLFFYGLERRVLVTDPSDVPDLSEIGAIFTELSRLLALYSAQSPSFSAYGSGLQALLANRLHPHNLCQQLLPELPSSYDLPLYLAVALGQTVVAKEPVPAPLALAWALRAPLVIRRIPVSRCPVEFEVLFLANYVRNYGSGLRISVPKSKAKLTYRPASGGFIGVPPQSNLGDLPDVSQLLEHVAQLQAIVDECATVLEPYSRYLGRNPGKRATLRALLSLPVSLWPSSFAAQWAELRSRVGTGMLLTPVHTITLPFNDTGDLSKDQSRDLARALLTLHLGMEPNVLGGEKLPKPEENIVLFYVDDDKEQDDTSAGFHAASVTVELACLVAHSNKVFSARELQFLTSQIDSWAHLTVTHRQRLKARARLLTVNAVPLASMKKKVEPLSAESREAIAGFVALMVQTEGQVSKEEIKCLEDVYRVLNVEQSKVYSAVHAAATQGPARAPSTRKKGTLSVPSLSDKKELSSGSFTLDTNKIAELQQDSESVAKLLGTIFNEEPAATPVPFATMTSTATEEILLAGLDIAHSTFARTLMTKGIWSRGAALFVATGLGLMLDGALEKLNEAALDEYDEPFTEGDDPIEVNPFMIEKLLP
ncbi:MAG: TerB N-terminal domain-containing protein [Agitococcus sp.]|nr:TerB N-terminal domain-containing protein [Agitococcus sp.]MDO9179315.1 TerB N-terminal domain-containing protein [Agitococcus sp.]